MGTSASKSTDGGSHGGEGLEEENLDHAGGQLYISLKMENYKLKGELIPHVYGSVPIVGSWDSSKAVCLIFFPFFLTGSYSLRCCISFWFRISSVSFCLFGIC